jgi:nitrile hydratase accessory protein
MKNTLLSIDDLPALPRDKYGPVFNQSWEAKAFRDKDGPVFNQPWEAKAFALAVRLSEASCFTWPEWVRIFSQEVKAAQERGDPDLGTYYQHWLNALERICAEKGLVGREDMRRRKAAWRRAYLNTPHGQPIDLAAAFKPQRRREKPSPHQ